MLETFKSGSVRFVSTIGPVGLGWRGWHPPNVASTDQIACMIDGKIFNAKDLIAGGPTPKNDANLFIALYQKLGFVEAMKRINGDLSVAIVDLTSTTVWLGRDRLGVKPLYFTESGDHFAFASQPGGLTALPWVDPRPDPRFIALFAGAHYRAFDNAPEKSPYRSIQQLPAGHTLEWHSNRSQTKRYWELQQEEEFTQTEEELAEQYRELFLDSVRIRLDVSQNPAFTLSGGLDSSSVTSCATKISGKGQDAFSSTYTDQTFDESEDIQPMLSEKVEKWHPVQIGNDLDIFDYVQKMVQANDEPVATATWLSHFEVCRQVADDQFTALFGGLGGDELNAGEYEYFPMHFADLAARGETDTLENEIDFWIQYHDHPIHKKSSRVAYDMIERLTDSSRSGHCKHDISRLRKYAQAVNPDLFDLQHFEPSMDHPISSHLKNRTYQDLFRETAPCCLRAEDRQTTYFSLDRFDPFMDFRLVEFMFRVPGTFKIRDGVTKRLLREAMKGILPEETRTRIAKTGWNAPAHVWFSGKNLEHLMDLVRSQTFRERGIYQIPFIEQIVDEHQEIVASDLPRENHMMFLWQLINIETWFDVLETKASEQQP